MITVKSLRVLIVCLWLTYVLQIITLQVYDPRLESAMLTASDQLMLDAIRHSYFYYFLIVEAFLWIYASAALWFAHKTGKWAFLAYITLALFSNCFIDVQASSWLYTILENITYLLLGMLVLALYASVVKARMATNTFQVGKFLIAFFIFFVLFFALPIAFSYLAHFSLIH